MSEFVLRKAQRRAVPLIGSVSGVSGSGKTYSALLLAAGIAGPTGRVGMLDTENGRGEMYADSPGIMKALPNGFEYMELRPDFTPARYIQAIDAMEQAGVTVCVIDSGSHEWEGTGGCTEMAEKNKGRWAKPKIENRKYVNRLLFSTMHIIVCLRAREKSKIIAAKDSPTKKEEVISLGILPVAEKNFVYEALFSLMVEEGTHYARPIKVPEPLLPLFPMDQPRLITKMDGEKIRLWNEGGSPLNAMERIDKQARAAATEGMVAYTNFFKTLTADQKRHLVTTTHEANKQLAAQVDEEITREGAGQAVNDAPKGRGGIPIFGSKDQPVEWPVGFEGKECIWNGDLYRPDENYFYQKVEEGGDL